MTNREEIERRRTFAIISHPRCRQNDPDRKACCCTVSHQSGRFRQGQQSAKHAVSDWMDIEKQRGISVTSSVLQFNYAGKCVNILDTPGHQDFSEDTYRTLMAAGLRCHGHRCGKGALRPDHQAVQGLHPASHPHLHLHQQDGPRSPAIPLS